MTDEAQICGVQKFQQYAILNGIVFALPALMSNILVVDDEEDIGVLMKAMLRSAGYNVFYARTIKEAEESLLDRTFTTVFLDLNLDDEYGLCLIPAIRKTNSSAVVVVITAQKEIEVKEEVEAKGIRYFIEKPFNKSQIISMLAKSE